MDKIFLHLISFLNPVLQRAGVDTYQLYQILRIKLVIDNRRPKVMFANKRNATTGSGNVQSPWLTTFFTLLMGFFIGLFLFLSKTPYIGQSFYFIVFMVLMSLTLISDFTTVLIDVRDQYILLPRPVNDRTITVARILHISIYILRLALLQGLPGLVMIGFIDGVLAIPVFFIQILEATFLSIFIVNMVYLLLMKFVSPQRFKDVISYFQVVFSILIFGTYYILPRIINVSAVKNIALLNHWWAYCLPPVWITALNELLIHPSRSGLITSVLAIAGLVTPLIGLWFVAKVLAPGFNRRLSIIATSDGNSNSATNIKKAGKFSLIGKIANIVAPDPVENAGFRITWKLATRTREFKIKVYPAFGYIPIYFFVFVFNGKKSGSLADSISALQSSSKYIFLIYLCTFILTSILGNISMSGKYKSAWVYYALPINQPGKILSGMYKAIIVIFFLPYCLVISIAIIAFWGPQAVNDVLLAFLVALVYGMLMALFMVKGLPFSKPVIAKQGGGRVITSLMMLVFIGGLGYGHYYLIKWEGVIWALVAIFVVINWMMFHFYKKQSWDNIELEDNM